jgi:thermitase
MKKYLFMIAAVFLTGATSDTSFFMLPPFQSKTKVRSFYTDRVLVHMKAPDAASVQQFGSEKSRMSEIEKLSNRSALAIKKHIPLGKDDYALLSLDESTDDVESAIARLQSDPSVESVQPDFIYTKTMVPNDTNYGQLWGLKNSAQTIVADHATQSLYTTGNPGTAGRDMGLETAWDKVTDCSSVVVAVIDTGMKMTHNDLKDNLWSNLGGDHGYDFVNSDTDPTDDEGHGTHVAGTIGARGNNALGTTGVCWRVQLMAVKVLDSTGSGSTSNVIAGVQYAVANGAKIINMSLGGSSFDTAYLNAVNAAGAAGVLVVVAAGNSGTNVNVSPSYPCSFATANLICVGAVDQKFAIASFSNYSTTSVDIGAPGTNVLSSARSLWGVTQTLSLAPGAWTSNNANFAATTTYLQNPAGWNGVTEYAADADDQTYSTFNMSGTVSGLMYFKLRGASESGLDLLSFYVAAGAGDPILPGNLVDQISGTSNGLLASEIFEIPACANQVNCTVGLRLTSNATVQNIGFRIESIQVDTLVGSNNGTDSLNGTSMASPHIAGLAALVKAYNPLFTAADIKNAILTTGTKMSALSAKFATGAVANAPNALKYVDPPTGVSAAVAP